MAAKNPTEFTTATQIETGDLFLIYRDGTFQSAPKSLLVTELVASNEVVQDAVGDLLVGNTETLITVTYDDGNNNLNFIVEDDLSLYNNSLSGFITADSTDTFTNKTFDANATGNLISNIETEDIASSSKTGIDSTLVTGTAGVANNLALWNVDGDLVDASVTIADFQQTDEEIQDIVGGMFVSNSEVLIQSLYDDGTGKVDLIVNNDLSLYDNTNSAFITADSTDTFTNKTFSDNILIDSTFPYLDLRDSDSTADFNRTRIAGSNSGGYVVNVKSDGGTTSTAYMLTTDVDGPKEHQFKSAFGANRLIINADGLDVNGETQHDFKISNSVKTRVNSTGLIVFGSVNATSIDTTSGNEFTKTQNFDATTLTDGANISWDLESNQVTSVTLGGNRTLDNPTNQVDGATYILRVVQDGTGSRTLSFGTAYKFPGGTAPTLTGDANAVDILTFVSDGTNMNAVFQGDFS